MPVIRDVMQREVVVVEATSTVGEAIERLVGQNIGGAPVVDDAGTLLGYVGEMRLLDVLFDPGLRAEPVASCMTTEVPIVDPEDTLSHAAHLFELYGVRRLPVVEGDVPVGIVSQRDLLRYALHAQTPLPDPLDEVVPTLAELCDQADAEADAALEVAIDLAAELQH